MTSLSSLLTITGGAVAVTIAAYLGSALRGERRTLFLPGETSPGHRQIEMRCELCHRESFASADDIQSACVECHGDELREANDSHPRSKFTDPRNAERTALLDATRCATCHAEHVPERTGPMGVTLAGDYCALCHPDIAEERPSHRGASFASCASSGCHNFHDNRALYEDFLVEHAEEPSLLAVARVPERTRIAALGAPLAAGAHDAPAGVAGVERAVVEWSDTTHARAGVNCSDCHVAGEKPWSETVDPGACGRCHDAELRGFERGRHGMRHAADLSPMQPARSVLAMRDDASERSLDCAACHASHAFDVRRAAVEACLGCHEDDHSRAYPGSPHALAWEKSDGSGVSCATCHLPRAANTDGAIQAQHGQNDNLRPNEKMIRSVCMSCHGLAFSIDALADPALIRSNFNGKPRVHVESIDWARRRLTAESESPSHQEEAP